MQNRFYQPILIILIILGFSVCKASAQPRELNQFNVRWDSPSKNSKESMPCGGGDIGMNVWVENGDLLVYIDRSGNIDENDQQLKTGRVRLRLNPNPFSNPETFRQELKLKDGCIEIESTGVGLKALVKVWVQVNDPVIHFDVNANKPIVVQAFYENWRNQKHLIPRTLKSNGEEDSWDYNRWSMFGYFWYEGDVHTYPDSMSFSNNNRVLFYHRNTSSDLIFDKEIKLMHLDKVENELAHPTKNRMFGGIMSGDGMISGEISTGVYANTPFRAWELHSEKPRKIHHIRMVLNTARTLTSAEWKNELDKEIKTVKNSDSWAWKENQLWWKHFWERSFVFINPDSNDINNVPWQLGRNFQLFRYQLACNVHGEWPTRFNGGLFTYDPVYSDNRYTNPDFGNPDFRAWGAWTAQNQRLVYWPMLKNGDFDVILPQFEFYRKNMPNATLRTKVAWNFEGCSFCEQIGSGGLPLGSHYGWEPPFGKRDPQKEVGLSDLHATYYTSQLEFAYMIHEWYRFSGGDLTPYLSFLKNTVIFHFNNFEMLQKRRTGQPYDENGKLVIDPSHALETYHGKNSTDVLCALRTNLECLINLPEKWFSKEEKKQFSEWLERVPPINFRMRSGVKTISPIEGDPHEISNYEIPQLYPVFPWPIYGIGKPDLQVAIDTWKYGVDAWTIGRKPDDQAFYPAREYWFGWTQQAIWLARLGLTDEAKDYLVKKLSNARGNNEFDSPSRMRFPSFWGPGFDWAPDHNWGGSGMIAMQEMLMQTSDSTIYILPAWPKDWDVHFKLHAPYNTTVEVSLKKGKIEQLKVIPESREKDVRLMLK